ncbi:hypothetical protein P3342_011226 [Pyrenophora teres f. teres]|nr:hypothetical protein P3342_011226 [Pyrenophora teres f. teres]
MARGPVKHQKRLSAPNHWLLDKLSGAYAPKASPGPHKLRDSLPLVIFLRNRLKYALNAREVNAILMQRLVKVDGKVRTDSTFPSGLMDVISIEKTGENFRLIYDTKGRFTVHRITDEEAQYKLGKVKRVQLGKGGIPTWLRTMRERSATPTQPSRSTTPSRSTSPLARSATSSSSTLVSLSWSLVVVTWVVLVSSPTVSVTMEASTLSTSRTLLTTSSPLVSPTSSSSERRSHGSRCPRVRVSSSRLLRSVTAAGRTPSPATKGGGGRRCRLAYEVSMSS